MPCRSLPRTEKIWKDSDLFEEWVRELDDKFVREDRHAQKYIPTVNTLTVMKLLVLSWEDVTESTKAQNCFSQSDISVEERDRAQNDLDYPYSVKLRAT